MTTETAREAVARLPEHIELMCEATSLTISGARLRSLIADAVAGDRAWLDAHGWQIVPKEPTPAMAAEGKKASLAEGAHDCEVPMTDVYRAMLAAAPPLGE